MNEMYLKNLTCNILNEVNIIGIQEYMKEFEKRLGGRLFICDSFFNELLKVEGKGFLSRSVVSIIKEQLPQQSSVLYQETTYSVFPFTIADRQHGYFVIEGETVTEQTIFQLDAFVPVLISELKKREEIQVHERKYQINFIYDLLHNNIDSQFTAVSEAKAWGWDVSVPHQLILIESDDQVLTYNREQLEKAEKLIRNVLKGLFYKPVVVDLNGVIIVLINIHEEIEDRKLEAKKVAQYIHNCLIDNFKGIKVRFGIGKFYPTIIDISRSYQEAKMALKLGSGSFDSSSVTHFEDLGAIRLLANIRQEQLNEFCQEYLGKLIDYDQQNETDMLYTLKIYLVENGNLKTTSDKLYVHINTLRNRIKKIEQLLNVNLQNSDDLLNLLISMKIQSMY